MKIIENNFFWNGVLSKRTSTKYIVLHHRAGEGDAQSIHSQHLNQGWSGIGYHFYIRKNGEVYQGRPIDTIGAHTQGSNAISVGVCFEGNYEKKKEMPTAQFEAGKELISYLKKLYPYVEVKGHRNLQATACPGKYFPFEEIIGEENELTEACKLLTSKGIINSPDYWAKGRGYSDANTVSLIKKFANYVKNKAK